MTTIKCNKCGRMMTRCPGSSILSHPEDYMCGICAPKKFSDIDFEKVIFDFMEKGRTKKFR